MLCQILLCGSLVEEVSISKGIQGTNQNLVEVIHMGKHILHSSDSSADDTVCDICEARIPELSPREFPPLQTKKVELQLCSFVVRAGMRVFPACRACFLFVSSFVCICLDDAAHNPRVLVISRGLGEHRVRELPGDADQRRAASNVCKL